MKTCTRGPISRVYDQSLTAGGGGGMVRRWVLEKSISNKFLLLLLLSRISRVRLCATP